VGTADVDVEALSLDAFFSVVVQAGATATTTVAPSTAHADRARHWFPPTR
jgi:hypothetical protein